MFEVRDDPASWPFCLSEQEFEFYATQNFGGEIGKVEGVYHPPSFYGALARDVLGVAFTVVTGIGSTFAFPEAVAGAAIASKIAPLMARGVTTGVIGVVSNHFVGADPFDAALKSTLWPRYELDDRRRKLT